MIVTIENLYQMFWMMFLLCAFSVWAKKNKIFTGSANRDVPLIIAPLIAGTLIAMMTEWLLPLVLLIPAIGLYYSFRLVLREDKVRNFKR